jgi:23S rRNA-/tRNA-specific pseudouridylate synthase
MGIQFEKRKVKKRYEALVIGDPFEAVELNSKIVLQDDRTLLIDSPIEMEGRGTLPARTTMSVLESVPHTHWGTLSHLELRPETGRTHQLRVSATIVQRLDSHYDCFFFI